MMCETGKYISLESHIIYLQSWGRFRVSTSLAFIREEERNMGILISSMALVAMVASHMANPVVACPDESEYDYR